LIESRDGLLYATEIGTRQLKYIPPLPRTTDEVLNLWKPKLGRSPSRILDAVISAYRPLAKAELAEVVGLRVSGTFNTYLSSLRTAGLIKSEDGKIVPDREALFL